MTRKQSEYDDCNGGRRAHGLQPLEAEWLRTWNWKYWVTLTFGTDVGRDRADAILDEFLNELEAAHRDSMTCMIAQEQKTYSGSGKPAGRVHFHLVLGCAINLTAAAIENRWKLPEFGGCRTSGSSAYVEAYDPKRGCISYMLKFQTDPAWDVRYRNLELLSPIAPNSAATSSSTRRKLARCAQRRADASKASASTPTRITA